MTGGCLGNLESESIRGGSIGVMGNEFLLVREGGSFGQNIPFQISPCSLGGTIYCAGQNGQGKKRRKQGLNSSENVE